jgi:hypothetical protein
MFDNASMIAVPLMLRRFARFSALLIATVALSVADPAVAQVPSSEADAPRGAPSTIVSVVELFTSQGCSSCPPADALLKTYAARPDVLAISLPVDYWDYLGWKDTFGSAKHTERQRNYAKTRGDGQVYTPQAVVNGIVHVNGASAKDIDGALADSQVKLAAERVPLRFWTNRGSLIVEAEGAPDPTTVKEATIWLAVIQKTADVLIDKGENRGKTLAYTNVVRELTPVGTWTGRPLRIQLARSALMRPGLESVAVLIQQGKAGPIIGAAVTGLW